MGKPKAKRRTRREAATTDAASTRAKPRKRQGNVRGIILGLLQTGPKSSSALAAGGRFSAAAGFLNLRAMTAEGLLSSARQGREVLYSLTSAGSAAATEGAVAAPGGRGRKSGRAAARGTGKGAASAGLSTALRLALESMGGRGLAIEDLDRKRLVLDRLVTSLPAPVAAVLKAIRADLDRANGHPGRRRQA